MSVVGRVSPAGGYVICPTGVGLLIAEQLLVHHPPAPSRLFFLPNPDPWLLAIHKRANIIHHHSRLSPAFLLCPHIMKTTLVHNYKYCLPAPLSAGFLLAGPIRADQSEAAQRIPSFSEFQLQQQLSCADG